MSLPLIALISFFSGLFASLGLGGGMILITCLLLFTDVSQLIAQGINLVFFVPIAILSLILHSRNGLVKWKKIIPVIVTGIISASIFGIIASKISEIHLKKFFAIFLIAAGIKELATKSSNN